jgi:hypothetical protein
MEMRRFAAIALLAACTPDPPPPPAPPPPPESTFDPALIRIAAPEPWESIPWRASLWEARRESARTGRPLLIWAMNGHPMGCV